MSSIFISHSSDDEAIAQEIKDRLAKKDHHSIFLDFDHDKGIQAGQSWEQTLYRKLRACQAVIAICTDNYFRSQWCFAEIALARMEGKQIFALKFDPLKNETNIPSIISERQWVDLRQGSDQDPEEEYERLWNGLKAMHILGVSGEWTQGDSPYLGLNVYKEEHTEIFFGREEETRFGLELVHRGSPGFIMILGASGSGKSSLVRAGMIPRLRQDKDYFLVVDPFRPGRDPFISLVNTLSNTFWKNRTENTSLRTQWDKLCEDILSWNYCLYHESTSGKDISINLATPQNSDQDQDLNEMLSQLKELLTHIPITLNDPLFDELTDRLSELRFSQKFQGPGASAKDFQETPLSKTAEFMQNNSEKPDARILVIIDQFEEFFGEKKANKRANQFLSLLRITLELQDSPLMVLGTLRSDFLGSFQKNPTLRGMDFESMSLGPMTLDGMRRVIEEPAKLGSVELGKGLVDRLLADTETPDALPLLSFTLWILWRDYGKDGKLVITEYEHLKGLDGAIRKTADPIYERAKRKGLQEQLNKAFLSMVRLTEDGIYVRQSIERDSVDDLVQSILKEYEKQRLVFSNIDGNRKIVEVTHEALFRSWEPYKKLLELNYEFKVWQSRIKLRAKDWKDGNSALLTGVELEQAKKWHTERQEALTSEQNDYILRSIEKHDNELQEKEKQRQLILKAEQDRREAAEARVLEEKKIKKLLQLLLYLAIFGGIFITGLFLYFQRKVLLEQAYTSMSEARALFQSGQEIDALVTILNTGKLIDHPLVKIRKHQKLEYGVRHTLAPILSSIQEENHLQGHDGRVKYIDTSPDGKYIATAGYEGTAKLWNTDGKSLGACTTEDTKASSFMSVGFNPDSSIFAAGVTDGALLLCSTKDAGKVLKEYTKAHDNTVQSLTFLKNIPKVSSFKITGFDNQVLCNPSGIEKGDIIATSGRDGFIKIWQWANDSLTEICKIKGYHNDGHIGIYDISFSVDGKYLFSVGDVNVKWSLEGNKPQYIGKSNDADTKTFSTSITHSPDGQLYAISSTGSEKRIKIFSTNNDKQHKLDLNFSNEITNWVRFSPDKNNIQFVSVGDDGISRIWDIDGSLINQFGGQKEALWSASFSHDGTQLIAAGDKGIPKIWKTTGNTLASIQNNFNGVKAIDFNQNKKFFAGVFYEEHCQGKQTCKGGYLRIWNASGTLISKKLLAHKGNVWDLSISSDGEYIATAGDNSVQVWRVSHDTNELTLSSYRELKHSKVQSVDFQPDHHNHLISGGKDGKVQLWNINTQESEEVFDYNSIEMGGELLQVRFHPMGKKVAFVGGRKKSNIYIGHTFLMNLSGNKIAIQNQSKNFVADLSFSHDGQYLVSAGNDLYVRIWDVRTNRIISEFKAAERPITSVLFNESRREIVTSGYDQFINLWDLKGQNIATLKGGQDFLYSMTFLDSEMGRSLATAGNDGTIKTWRLGSLRSLMEQGCKQLSNYLRNASFLSHKEKDLYESCKGYDSFSQ